VSPLPALIDQLAVHGPWLLLLLAILETCFVTGLVVPSGLATSAATILVLEGEMALTPMLAAAVTGGFLGDTIGFWIGKAWGERVLHRESRWYRLLGPRRRELDALFRRHPVYSVTTARLVSFVRTVMPMAAGMSGMSYRRYVPYEVVGLLGWAAIYVAIGVVGGEGWEIATQLVGVGGAAAFAVGTLIALWMVRRRRRRRRSRSEPERG
jgi:membrane protein DedA with SNARE-associated domain